MGETMFEKIWRQHLVADLPDGSSLIYIDRVLLHERTGSIALKSLAEAGRTVRNPSQVLVCMDHIVDTFETRSDETTMPGGKAFITETREAAAAAGLRVLDVDDPQQGIVHVVSPELGFAQPGLTVICPDSHTCTQGGVGALAWGIGSTEAEHALATETLVVRKPRTMKVAFNGRLGRGVSAKDMILHLIGRYTAAGGAGHVLEFTGETVAAMSIEARLTLCNMAVEFAAWTGMCPPDETTLAYVKDRPLAPQGELWDQARADWLALRSDPDATYDKVIEVDAAEIAPMVTWGTSPQHAVPVTGRAPDPDSFADAESQRAAAAALAYMGLEPGAELAGLPIQSAFIGSCTNGRLSDLRAAAEVLKGRHVAPGVRAIVVPGSMQVRAAAEAEGLDQVFKDAGFEWRKSGCSMCFFAGGEHFAQGERVVTSTNRNFENRQGPGVRSHLASPASVAASAVMGRLADVRDLEG